MRLVAMVWFTGSLVAQEQAPSGLARGILESRAGTLTSGTVAIRSADGQVRLCAYNDKSYMERGKLRIAASSLKPGDHIEMVADRSGGSCYARIIHVLSDPIRAGSQDLYRARLRAWRPGADSIVPRGNLTFSGIVLQVEPRRLVLRTRSDGLKTILLRQDTGYTGRGLNVEVSALSPLTLVFIRGGRNPEGDLEAYHVMWGEILSSRRSGDF